jgi:hypothetical protein
VKNTVLAAAAAFALALSVAPTFAAQMGGGNHDQQAQRSESSSTESQCHNILANPEAYPASVVRKCKWQY